jgi:hypothetical protein
MSNSHQIALTDTQLKYLRSLVRLQSVALMANESCLSIRSIQFHLKSIDWVLSTVE